MSSTVLDEPVAGCLLVALRPMRAWENDDVRGELGTVIMTGEQALLLATWLEGKQRRLRVVRDQRIFLFSCADHTVNKNWRAA